MSMMKRCDACGAPAPMRSEYNRYWYKITHDNWRGTFDVCPRCAKACGLSEAFSVIREKCDSALSEAAARAESGE